MWIDENYWFRDNKYLPCDMFMPVIDNCNVRRNTFSLNTDLLLMS